MIFSKRNIYRLVLFILFNSLVFSQNIESFTDIMKPTKWLVGANLSTFGLGLEGRFHLSDKFNVRSRINYLKYSYPLDKIRDDLRGDIKVAPFGISTNVDYWIISNVFLSVGATLNSTKILIAGMVSESVLIGDIEMLPDEVGLINAKLTPRNYISPYLGVGIGPKMMPGVKIYYIFESGILFHGKPQVKLSATGMLTPTANDAQETLIEENIAPLSFYPIISFSIYYNFISN